MKPTILFLSCEHAVDTVPEAYLHLFQHYKPLLKTHRAIDFGALEIAMSLNQTLACEYVTATVTRLLIDCNRSLTSPNCFSEVTSDLPDEIKKQLIEHYYLPYRTRCETLIKAHIDRGHQVLHISVHSFTPSFNGTTRNAGICLLYDPKRHGEKEVARLWHGLLSHETPAYRIRMNYPYRGTSDGFTSALRKQYSEKDYLGFELEMNQALLSDKKSLDTVADFLSRSIKELLLLL